AVAVPAIWLWRAAVEAWTAAWLGIALPGTCASGGIPPHEPTVTAPIHPGGVSGAGRRAHTAQPKAGALRASCHAPPGRPRVGSRLNTIGCGEFVMFIAETTVFHSVAGFQFLNAMPTVFELPGATKL